MQDEHESDGIICGLGTVYRKCPIKPGPPGKNAAGNWEARSAVHLALPDPILKEEPLMKKKAIGRLGVLALALTLISTCLMGGTLAKYTADVTGSGSATVAKWSFKANEQTTSFTDINLANTAYTNVAKEKIAPGTQGSFDIKIDASGSEVAVDYTIKLSEFKNRPTNLKFYSDEACTEANEIKDFANYKGLDGTIAFNAADKAVTKTVYWKWDYETNSGDTSDTTDGTKAEKMTFTITITGTQATPVPTTAPTN